MIRIREVSRIWFEAKVRVRHPHMTSLCRSVYRGVGWRASGGGRFHCDDNIALGGIGEAEMQISWRTALFSVFSSMDDEFSNTAKERSITRFFSIPLLGPNTIDNQFFSSVKTFFTRITYIFIFHFSNIICEFENKGTKKRINCLFNHFEIENKI